MSANAQPPAKQPDNANIVRFPPFPRPPPGVHIIPFKDFRECGIRISSGNNDVELDGRNVPTVELRHGHEADVCKTNTKRKRKKIKANGTDASTPVVVPKKEWWQTWEENEEQRLYRYDTTALSPIDRILSAAADFRSRPWPSNVPNLHTLWDQFRLFVGLLASTPALRKGDGGKSAPDEDSDEDFGDADPIGVSIPTRQQCTIDENTTTVVDNDKEANGTFAELDEIRENKLNSFLNDPETTIKIFLTSYMRKQGLIWAERNLTLVPHLLSFFLRFLLRNGVFPEPGQKQKYQNALDVVKLGMKELPLTSKMSKAMPDAFQEGCKECWGPQSEIYMELSATRLDDADNEPERDSKRQRLGDRDAPPQSGQVGSSATEGTAFEAELRAANVAVVAPGQGINLVKEVITDNMNADDSGWGVAPAVVDSEWGGGWATDTPGTDAFGILKTAEDDEAWRVPVRSLMPLLGPTALPNTHTTGIVESSMRRIISVTAPAGLTGQVTGAHPVELELKARFARVVLAPWTGWEAEDEKGFSDPKILQTSRGAVVGHEGQSGGRKPHDPTKDEITVLFDPSVVPTMGVGMGIGAIWVQIIRREQESREGGLTVNGRSEKTHAEEALETYWYMEKLSMTFPSFYTPL